MSHDLVNMRLSLILTGDQYASQHVNFRVGRTTVGLIVADTCQAIVDEFQEEVSAFPTDEAGWRDVARRFGERWNFPHALGALDGKHIRIRNPPNGGSSYFNYKKYFSIVLLALVDADYRFMYVECGAKGSNSDAGLFNRSDLLQEFENGNANS